MIDTLFYTFFHKLSVEKLNKMLSPMSVVTNEKILNYSKMADSQMLMQERDYDVNKCPSL